MENMKCVLITKDKVYGERFCKCIRESKRGLNICLLEEAEAMTYCDIVLWDWETLGELDCMELEKTLNISKAIIFNMKPDKDEDDDLSLYKYDSLFNTIKKIVEVCNIQRESFIAVPVNTRQCRITAVSAAHGGAGCSSIALAIARDYAFAGHKRAIYISLHSRSDELKFVESFEGKNLRQLLYKSLYCPEEVIVLEDYLTKDYYGVDFFKCSGYGNQLNRLTLNQWHQFIEFVLKKNFFEEIIIDLGTNTSEIAKSVRTMAQFNLAVYGEGNKAFADSVVAELFEGDFQRSDYMVIENFAYIPRTELDLFMAEDEEDEDIKKDLFRIERDDEAFDTNHGKLDVKIDTAFGKKIRQLIRNLN